MSPPYHHQGKLYLAHVQQFGAPTDVRRPSKLAAGMSYTAARGKHWRVDLAYGRITNSLILAVRGTLDRLAAHRLLVAKPALCPCCKAWTGKLAITPYGRSRLRRLRQRRLLKEAI